jgi:GPH family glycoside/pentoside/hexuronide:cation symporter
MNKKRPSSRPANHRTSLADRLSFWTKLVYGSGDTGFSLLYTVLDAYLLFFLVTVVKLPPSYAAVAIFMGRTWDWINDPLVGLLSDHTRSRWGRRRPYLLFGPIPFGLSFVLLWWVPPFQSHALLALYYGMAYFVFDTLATLVSVPYLALIPELTPDYDERTSINTYRMFFSIAAGILGFAAPELARLSVFPDVRTGYLVTAAAFAVIGTLPLWGVFAVAREKGQPDEFFRQSTSAEGSLLSSALSWLRGHWHAVLALVGYLVLWTGIFYVLPRLGGQPAGSARWTDFVFYAGFLIPMGLITWRAFRRNKPFLMAMGIFLLTWTTIAVIQSVLPFYITYWLGMESHITEIMGMVFVSALLWLPLCNHIAHRFSKSLAYIGGMGSLIVVLFLMAALPQSTPFSSVLLLSFLAGIGVSVAHVIPNAILPDSLEWDELRTGRRREGMYYSMVTLMNKVASSVAVPWAALILGLSGFNEARGPNQLDSTFAAIRLLVSLAPAVLMAGGILLAAYYPLTRERHSRIRQLLERRRLRRNPAP